MLFSRLVSKLAARTARVSGIFQTRFRKHHPGAADECPIQPAIEDIDDEHPTDNTMMSDQHTVQSLNNRGDSDQIRSATVTDNGEYRTESVAESSDSQSQIRSTVELEVHPTIENSQHQAHNTNNAYWFENEHTLCFERVTETAPVQVLWTPSCQIGRGIPWARSYADAARREHIPGARLEVDFGLPPSISIPWGKSVRQMLVLYQVTHRSFSQLGHLSPMLPNLGMTSLVCVSPLLLRVSNHEVLTCAQHTSTGMQQPSTTRWRPLVCSPVDQLQGCTLLIIG